MSAADRIRGYIAGELLDGAGHALDEDTPLLEGLLDSGALMRLVTFIEEEFQVNVEDSDVDAVHFRTIRDVERYVEAKLAQG
jgi:acyl carrier protein